eukprot:CAMPEP_0175110886 /NCGR_PEP_ID=MMETSP0086_2-20121207/14400_1 /TAXON_ID=136419 /ORGANISM="Unknown Unknown, Strain D1" /LENGTH=248 /DNA_ID=CAMNT_0016389175 /DNA_START=41 /DNA_END=787 /DNA_ORIENTATION=-
MLSLRDADLHLLSKRNAHLAGKNLQGFDQGPHVLAEFFQKDRFDVSCSIPSNFKPIQGPKTPVKADGKTSAWPDGQEAAGAEKPRDEDHALHSNHEGEEDSQPNGLMFITASKSFGKPLLDKFMKFLENRSYSDIIIVSSKEPTKAVQSKLHTYAKEHGIFIDIFETDELRIDRTANVYVPRYTLLRSKKEALEVLVTKNEADLDNLPKIVREHDLVARVLFRDGDYILSHTIQGTQMKRVVEKQYVV